MKNSLSLAEISVVTGIPVTTLRRRSKGWASPAVMAQKSKGGGVKHLYPVKSLPQQLQAAITLHQIKTALETSEAAKAGVEAAEKVKDDHQNKRSEKNANLPLKPNRVAPRSSARLAIVTAYKTFLKISSFNSDQSRMLFVKNYNEGQIKVLKAAQKEIPKISDRSLRRWISGLDLQGPSALVDNYGNRKNTGLIDTQEELKAFVASMIVTYPHCNASHVMQGVKARFKNRTDIDIPTIRPLRRWLSRYKKENAQILSAISNPDEWKNQFMMAFGSYSEGVEHANQLWEMDSTPADVMLEDGRHSIIGVVDVYTRRTKLLVSKTSRSIAIGVLIRQSLIDWGVPETVKTDNGQDYVSQYLTWVFQRLNVEQTFCDPFSPWQKPHIEQFFRTFSHDLVELLPGYIGHNVSERNALEAKAAFSERLFKKDGVFDVQLTSEDLQKLCDDYCDKIYFHNKHEGLEGKTPFQMVASCKDQVAKISDERVLDLLLAEIPGNNGMRTVQKKGIKLDSAWYIAAELWACVGQRVQVRYDPSNLGRIYVFAGDDLEEFLCIAECPERSGISRKEVAVKAKILQRKQIQEQKRELKKIARKVNVKDVVAEIVASRSEDAEKLTIMPKTEVEHQSSGLKAAQDAVAAQSMPTETTADIIDQNEFKEKRAKILLQEAQQASQEQEFETPFARAYWLETEARNRNLTEKESRFLAKFRNDFRAANRLDGILEARFG